MNEPIDHPYLPVFYTSRWKGTDEQNTARSGSPTPASRSQGHSPRINVGDRSYPQNSKPSPVSTCLESKLDTYVYVRHRATTDKVGFLAGDGFRYWRKTDISRSPLDVCLCAIADIAAAYERGAGIVDRGRDNRFGRSKCRPCIVGQLSCKKRNVISPQASGWTASTRALAGCRLKVENASSTRLAARLVAGGGDALATTIGNEPAVATNMAVPAIRPTLNPARPRQSADAHAAPPLKRPMRRFCLGKTSTH
jgi:hypothetical protein